MYARLLLSTQRSGSTLLKTIIRAMGQFVPCQSGGVGQAAIPSPKITPEDLLEVVEIWDEVLRPISGTMHGSMARPPLLAAAGFLPLCS